MAYVNSAIGSPNGRIGIGRPLVLEPASSAIDVGQVHTVTAAVQDLFGNPVALSDMEVTFEVIGANSAAGTVTTACGP